MNNIPPTTEPLVPLQGWHWRHMEELVWVNGIQTNVTQLNMNDNTSRYRQLQRWLQISRFWYYVIGQPMVCDADYREVVKAAIQEHADDPDGCQACLYWYWNWLPDRYNAWVKFMFNGMTHNPRYPWVYAEGIYRRSLDFSVQGGTLSSGKSDKQIRQAAKFTFTGDEL